MRAFPVAPPRPALLLAVVLAGAAACHFPGGGGEEAQPTTLAAKIIAAAWPSTPRNELLFPALREALPAARDRFCTPPEGTPPPPSWLEELASRPGCPETVRALLDASSPAAEEGAPRLQDLLTAAASCDDVASLSRLLARGGDPNRVDSCGGTALVVAAAGGAARSVDALIAAGANPNFSSRQGARSRTPLLAAAIRANPAIAEALLAAGANANAATVQGRSVLMFAAAAGSDPLVRGLLQHRASPCLRDDLGFTALDAANAHGALAAAASLKGPSSRCGRNAEATE